MKNGIYSKIMMLGAVLVLAGCGTIPAQPAAYFAPPPAPRRAPAPFVPTQLVLMVGNLLGEMIDNNRLRRRKSPALPAHPPQPPTGAIEPSQNLKANFK